MNDRSLKVNRVRLQVGHRDFDVEKKLRRDLKRTHALLADAQLLLSTVDNPGQNLPHGSKDQIERLHCQVRTHLPNVIPSRDAFTYSLSLCLLQSAGGERIEAAGGRERSDDAVPGAGQHPDRAGEHLQTEECGERLSGRDVHAGGRRTDSKFDFKCFQVDEQLALLQHEKVDLLKRLEEDQEDLNELMKKHKALIAQVLRLTVAHSADLRSVAHSVSASVLQ